MSLEVDRRELCEFLVRTFRPVISMRQAAFRLDMDPESLKRIEQAAIRKVAGRMMRQDKWLTAGRS